jgi:transcription antitermination protein NusB
MVPRSKARKRALDVLYEADVMDRPVAQLLEETLEAEPGFPEFARELVEGVERNREQLDSMIQSYAERWALERMPLVDRNLLRIAIFELLHRPDVPPGATIDTAVDLAKLLSTPDSGRFLNGILGRVAREHPRAP